LTFYVTKIKISEEFTMTTAADQIKEWVDRSKAFESSDLKALNQPFAELDSHLTLRSFIVGHALTEADKIVWKSIRANSKAQGSLRQGAFRNALRWYKYIEETNPDLTLALRTKPAPDAAAKRQADSYNIGLQDVEKGVITRFPPEPS
jgi:glutamyl-tRNA synthetase